MTGDPRSLATMAWKQLSKGQVGIAEEGARLINLPLVTAFPSKDDA